MSEQDSGDITWNVYDVTSFDSDFSSRVNVMPADFYTLAETLDVAISQMNRLRKQKARELDSQACTDNT